MIKISILHLSDIHFQYKKNEYNKAFRLDVQKKLLVTIENHVKKQEHKGLDFVAITGDIAFSGKEYKEAEGFFNELKSKLPKRTVFLPIPGNHDVDRDKVDEFFSLHRIVKEKNVDRFLENKNKIKDSINVKFKYFRKFSENLSPGLYDKKDDFFWVKNIKDKQVSFLGLNSCWACEDDEDQFNIALGFPQVKEAFDKSMFFNRILLMHHPPFNWLRDFEYGTSRIEIFKNCGLILCGHTHADHAYIFQDPSNACICLGANASYTNDKEGFIGFQFMTVEFKKNGETVKVWPYIFDKRRNDFVPDRERYEKQDGKEYFNISSFQKMEKVTPETGPPLIIPDEYKKWIREFFSTVPVDQLAKKGEVISISLPEVYIPLETSNPFYKVEKEKLIKKKDKKEPDIKEPTTIDIEELMGMVHFILLRGGAGMGKTTLIKHLAFTITQGLARASLSNCLPMIVFLKDLWPIYRDALNTSQTNITFEVLLKSYLEKNRCPIGMDIIAAYLSAGRALFLFDGLDEVPEKIRDDLSDILHEFWVSNKRNRFLFTGRPHGFFGKVVEKFGTNILDIEDLDNKKIETFIVKWFRAVSGQASGLADLTSADMISDVRLHEHVSVFTQNPLLLTAVCILYLVGGKRIPEQRADLYDRIVENLLYRRFHEPANPGKVDEVREFLMILAFSMQKMGIKSIDTYEAREFLKNIYPRKKKEKLQHFKKRIDELFEEIEPGCGLLNRLTSGEVEFFHLTFQEFLAAKHLLNMDIVYNEFLEDRWWGETMLLYIGLMSLEMKKKSNDLVIEILNLSPKEKKNRNYFKLMGSKALRDIQAIKREERSVVLARKNLDFVIDSSSDPKECFEAGEILGGLGDLRIGSNTMAKVEAGEFERGSNKDESEQPVRAIYLDDFMIGRYPVTNEEYKKFIEDDGYKREEYWTKEGWQWVTEERIIEPDYWHDRKWNGANFPVVGVCWYEAMAYAHWLREKTKSPFRLPTEAEWEKAARGPHGLIYPWGNEFSENKCNSYESGLNRTSPVGIFPDDKSSYGCMDMAGNVWEWCADWYKKDYYKKCPQKNPTGPNDGSSRVFRGGGWSVPSGGCRASYRGGALPSFRDDLLGFRLARSV